MKFDPGFSRTNRLYNINEKPFGSIRYYRYPHTMKQNIENAMKLYSGDKPWGLFADHLPQNLQHMNERFQDMAQVFREAGVPDMERLPEDNTVRGKFAKLFREFSTYLQAAQIQGFTWDTQEYPITDLDTGEKRKPFLSFRPGNSIRYFWNGTKNCGMNPQVEVAVWIPLLPSILI